MLTVWTVLGFVAACLVMFSLGWFLSIKLGQGKIANAEKLAAKIISESDK